MNEKEQADIDMVRATTANLNAQIAEIAANLRHGDHAQTSQTELNHAQTRKLNKETRFYELVIAFTCGAAALGGIATIAGLFG